MRSQIYWPVAAVLFMFFIGLPYQASAASGSLYVVAAESALLRDYPSPESKVLTRLEHLDQVEYVDSSGRGWWKVRSLRTGETGWMTSDLLKAATPTAPSAAAKTVYYYVNAASVNLRVIPLESSATTGTVQLNDRLEKLGASPNGWTKVRNPRNGNQGWLASRYLSSHLVRAAPAPAPAPKKRVRKAYSGKKKKSQEPPCEVKEQAKPM